MKPVRVHAAMAAVVAVYDEIVATYEAHASQLAANLKVSTSLNAALGEQVRDLEARLKAADESNASLRDEVARHRNHNASSDSKG